MVDQRSDVYALGVLVYEVLTGKTPPVGIMVNPSSMRQDLPQGLEQVVLKALAQNPEQRFQNPNEFSIAFQNAVNTPAAETAPVQQPPVPAPGVSQSVNVQQPQKSTNWGSIILVILLVLALIGGAFLIIPPLLEDDEEVVLPVEPTIEQPTAPPVEQPTAIEPTEDPDKPGWELPEELPEICNSLGFAAGIAVFGITAVAKKRKRDTYHTD